MLDLSRSDVLTFDCYGTLIDWEAGILTALRRALPGLDAAADDQLLEQFAAHEAAVESGPYQRLGLATIWIDRRHDRAGFGATPPATATPDARYPSMREFAEAAVPVTAA